MCKLNDWDKSGVAEIIQSLWLNNHNELEHRTRLADLVSSCSYLPSRDASFLEAGCGSGLVYSALVPAVITNYTGIDTSREMLKLANANYPQGKFIYGDIFNLDFPDKSFDIVASFEVLGHLPDIEIPIREMFRVAKKYLIFTIWVSDSDKITEVSYEKHGDVTFLFKKYARDEIAKAIPSGHIVRTQCLSGSCWAYLITI